MRAGEKLQALALLLPAAIAYVTPDAIELATALSSAVLTPPPRLMFATAGRTAFAVTQSMPWTMSAVVPLPAQLSTRTATMLTPLATPYVAAADGAGDVRAVAVAVGGVVVVV